MKKTRSAVIGVGYLGRFHAQKYAQIEAADLVGVVDTDEKRARKVADELGTRAFTDYRELLGGVDAVSVAVPTTNHREISIPFLESGAAVLVEKPMAPSVRDAQMILDAAEKTGSVLQVGHIERFNPALVKLKNAITRPMFMEIHRISPFRERGVDVDVILDLMIHDLDIILSLVDSEITSIEGVGVPVLTDNVDIANARIGFANGCIANVTSSRVSAEVMRKIRIFQPDSYISIDFAASAVDIYTIDEKKNIDHRRLSMIETDPLHQEIESFVMAARGSSEVVVDGHAGINALKVAETIRKDIQERL